MSEKDSLERTCYEIYDECGQFYRGVEKRLGTQAFGFKILYGPPLEEPPVLFLGYQPGGRSESDNQFERNRWPEVSEYATEQWALARILRSMFGDSLLRRSVGLNAIFVRSPNMHDYKRTLDLMPGLQEEIERFCLPRVRRLIEALQPQQVVAIGFPSLELFGRLRPVLTSSEGRVLVKEGKIGDRYAKATLHLSGARISVRDRIAIANCVLADVRDRN